MRLFSDRGCRHTTTNARNGMRPVRPRRPMRLRRWLPLAFNR